MANAYKNYLLISGIIIVVVYFTLAILKLVFHSKWGSESCPIIEHIQKYLLYGGIADILWVILCIIAPCCGFDPINYTVKETTTVNGRTVKEEVRQEEGAGFGTIMLCIAGISLLATVVLWGCGNAWVLNKYPHVNYENSTASNYCYPPLYKSSFSIVIVSDVWFAFFFFTICLICIRK